MLVTTGCCGRIPPSLSTGWSRWRVWWWLKRKKPESLVYICKFPLPFICKSDTWAYHASILAMATVIFTNTGMLAVQKGRLITLTFHVIQPDISITWTKMGSNLGCVRCPTVHGSAHHLSIPDIPFVITHCPPLVIVTNLHSTRASVGAVD